MSKPVKSEQKMQIKEMDGWSFLIGDLLTMIGQCSLIRELVRLRSINRHWKYYSSLPVSWAYTHWKDPRPNGDAVEIVTRFESVCRSAPYLRSIEVVQPLKIFSVKSQQHNEQRWNLLGQLVHLERLVFPWSDDGFPYHLPSTLTNLKHLVNHGQGEKQTMAVVRQEDKLLMSLPLLTLRLAPNDRLLHYWSRTSVGNTLIILHVCYCQTITPEIMSQFRVLEELSLLAPNLRAGETYAAFTHAPSLRILSLPIDTRDRRRPILEPSVVEPILSNPEFNRRLEYLHIHWTKHSWQYDRFSFSHQFCQRLTNECTSLLVLNISQQEGYYRPLTREDWRDRLMAQSSSPELTERELLRRSNERYVKTLMAERQIMKVSTANPVEPIKRPEYFSSSFASGTVRLPQHGNLNDRLQTKPSPLKSLKQRVKEEIAEDYPEDMELHLGLFLTASEAFRHSLRFLVLRKDRLIAPDLDAYSDEEDVDEDLPGWVVNGTLMPSRDLPQTKRGPGLLTPRQLEETRAQLLVRYPNLFAVQFGDWSPADESDPKKKKRGEMFSPLYPPSIPRLAEVASWMSPETSIEANLNLLNKEQAQNASSDASTTAATATSSSAATSTTTSSTITSSTPTLSALAPAPTPAPRLSRRRGSFESVRSPLMTGPVSQLNSPTQLLQLKSSDTNSPLTPTTTSIVDEEVTNGTQQLQCRNELSPPTLSPAQLHQFQHRGSLSRHEWEYQRHSPFHLIRAIKLRAGLPLHPSEENVFMRHCW